MSNEKTLSTYHYQRIAHSIGVNLYIAIISDEKKYKSLPKEFYRNYYQKDSDHYLDELVSFEMATQREVFGQNVYHITDKGIHIFRAWFEQNIKYVPKTKHNLDYVKSKINLYCWFRNYTLKADGIVECYIESYSKGYYVSHTQKDVIGMFEKQLKKFTK